MNNEPTPIDTSRIDPHVERNSTPLLDEQFRKAVESVLSKHPDPARILNPHLDRNVREGAVLR